MSFPKMTPMQVELKAILDAERFEAAPVGWVALDQKGETSHPPKRPRAYWLYRTADFEARVEPFDTSSGRRWSIYVFRLFGDETQQLNHDSRTYALWAMREANAQIEKAALELVQQRSKGGSHESRA